MASSTALSWCPGVCPSLFHPWSFPQDVRYVKHHIRVLQIRDSEPRSSVRPSTFSVFILWVDQRHSYRQILNSQMAHVMWMMQALILRGSWCRKHCSSHLETFLAVLRKGCFGGFFLCVCVLFWGFFCPEKREITWF